MFLWRFGCYFVNTFQCNIFTVNPTFGETNSFWPVDVNVSVELLQQEAVQLPLALRLLLLQQRAILTGSPAHSDQHSTDIRTDTRWMLTQQQEKGHTRHQQQNVSLGRQSDSILPFARHFSERGFNKYITFLKGWTIEPKPPKV